MTGPDSRPPPSNHLDTQGLLTSHKHMETDLHKSGINRGHDTADIYGLSLFYDLLPYFNLL